MHVCLNLYGPPQSVVDTMSDEKKAYVKKMLDLKPLNIRIFDHIDMQGLKIERCDEGQVGYDTEVLGLSP